MMDSARQTALFDLGTELPEGYAYVPEFITEAEEAALVAEIERLPLQEALYKEYMAKRRVMSFGHEYGVDAREPAGTPEFAPFLLPLRERVGRWLGIPASRFVRALVTEYRPGTALGWHRDAPHYEVVAGISLAGWCRMRFRPYRPAKATGGEIQTPVTGHRVRGLDLELEPRSAYVMRGQIRWRWQHSIPPTKNLRFSITFRTLVMSSG